MCSQLHRPENAEIRVRTYYYMKLPKGPAMLKCALFGILWSTVSALLIFASHHVNLRTDALLNVTRIAGHDAGNATLYEDLSNCTTSSLKNCKLLYNGSWYIEAKNSLYGKLLKYSYFVEDGEVVSCQQLGDDGLPKDDKRYRLPCSYYVGLSFSLGSLLTAVLIVKFTGSDLEKMTYYNMLGMGSSWGTFLLALYTAGGYVGFKDFRGNMTEIYYRALPALLHFYLLAIAGWMSLLSQRHFLVKKRTSTGRYIYDLAAKWGPFLSYFPAFLFLNWLLTFAMPLFPYSLVPACEESCWLTQKNLLLSFAAPLATFAVFNVHGFVRYRDSYLLNVHLGENFLVLSKLFCAMVLIWFFGIWAGSDESFFLLGYVFELITLCAGFGMIGLGILFDFLKSRN